MRISWVLSEDITADELDANTVSDICPTWGSWKTWKTFKTDNCICTNASEATDLIQRAFHAVCNFYLLKEVYTHVGNPAGVKLFDGNFKDNVINKDDIVALNLTAPTNDIVLLSGFNFTDEEARREYNSDIKDLIKTYSSTQFVLVDYKHKLPDWAAELENLTTDSLKSIKNLLI